MTIYKEASNPWSPDWSNHVFTLAERERRWGKVRALMAREGIDLILCLPCTNFHGHGQADARYLSQLGENSDEATVAFPIEGPITAWHSRGGVWPSSNWLTDIRAIPRGLGGESCTTWLNENPQYQKGRIGIAGLTSTYLAHVRAGEGEVNWQSVEILKRNFPDAEFVSATPILGEARWRKSAEEVDFLRRATIVGEKVFEAVTDKARIGMPEREIFGHMMFANAAAGGGFCPIIGWYSGPDGVAYHRVEQPSLRSLQSGDALHLETEGRWGGYIVQIDQTWGVGDHHPDLPDAMKVVFEAYDRVLDMLKPGVLVRDLKAAGLITGLGGRARTRMHAHGRGTGDDGPLVGAGRPEPEAVLNMPVEEGCTLAIKPSIALDDFDDIGRWGDGVVVTATGAERLGTRAQKLDVIH